MALNARQRIFIDEYLKCWNATEAARRAEYSEKTARAIGAENLTKPDIAAEIAIRLKASQMSADEALQRTSDIGAADVADLVDDDGYFDFKKAKREGKTKLLKKLRRKVTTTRSGEVIEEVEFEMYDAQVAQRDILKIHGKIFDKSEMMIVFRETGDNSND